MVASAMESKRLGLCQKSIFVVPNHLTEQWASEFLRLYPSANILVTTKKDFETHNRKKFCARIATGDYDAVIIGHSQFERIPISPERQERLLHQQIEEITDGIQDTKLAGGNSFTIKSLERTKKGLEARLKKLQASDRKDDVIYFEQLGVDRMFVDESDNYKNLFLYTKMRNVAGLSTTDAQKSSDMFSKCRYMDELTGGRGVVFATGTPVSNSMTELYTIQRYLQHDRLQEMGMGHFDCWASRFGETTTALELAPEGTGYRARTRFAKFFNLPELMNLFKEVADIKTADQLHLPTPEVAYHTIATKPTQIQQDMVKALSERASKVHSGAVSPDVDNMLKITSDGRKLGLDQRIINPMLPDEETTKVNQCVANILQYWRDGEEEKLTQLVFCDISTPKSTPSQRAAKASPGTLDSPEIHALESAISFFMREQSGRKECFFMPKYKATAYIRLSYTDDHSSESDSVSNQRKLIENFVERNPDIEVVSEKIDDGYSGIIFDRPAFKEMMQDVTDGNINCVIVKDLSRLGREYIETGRYLRRVFPAYGVRFIAITDSIDTAHDSGDDLTVSVKNIMNEAYCRDISIKTRSSLDVKRRNGDFVGAFPVYGYMKAEDNKNLLVPDPYAARVVCDIFRMRLEGASASKIASELNRLGILSPLAYKKNNGLPYAKKGYADKADCKWSATTIIRILQDETYTGTLVQGKQGTPHYKIKQMEQRPASEWVRVPDAHEALIARQDFELVQRIKGLDTRTSPNEDTVYLFSGILICGCCGSRMTRKTNRANGKEYHYYYCPTGKKKGCTHPVMLKESSLIDCVRDSLKAYIGNIASLEALLSGIDQSSINQALAKEYSDHITDNERRLEQVLEFKARLYESLVGGMLTKEEYASYKAKYTKQAEDIRESVRVLKEKLTEVLENRSERNRWISQFTQFSTLETLDRRALIHMVHVKCSNAPKGRSIAYTIGDRGGVHWEGYSEMTADDLTQVIKRKEKGIPYEREPLVQVFNQLITNKPGGGFWSYSDLKSEGAKILGFPPYSDLNELRSKLDGGLAKELQQRDGLLVTHGAKGRSRAAGIRIERYEVPQAYQSKIEP